MEFATKAINAKKNVLLDKPTALNQSESGKLFDLARQHPEIVTLIDHELRFLKSFQKMRELIASGEIGQIYHVEGRHSTAGKNFKNFKNTQIFNFFFVLSFRLFKGRSHTHSYNWWSDYTQGGGALGACGSHLIDAMCFVSGRKFASVSGDCRVMIPQRTTTPESKELHQVTADDFTTANVKFDNGISGHFLVSFVSAGPSETSVKVYGTKGKNLRTLI